MLKPPGRVPIVGTDFCKHDVVQVIDATSRLLGVFFILGDIKRGKAHGYYMLEGQKKEFVTVPVQHIWHIGTAKIRAQTVVSEKWKSDNA